MTQRRMAALVGAALAVGLLAAHSAVSTRADSSARVGLSYGRASDGEAPAGARAVLPEQLLRHTPAPSATPTTLADTPVPPTLTATALPPSATALPPSATALPPSATALPPSATPTMPADTPV